MRSIAKVPEQYATLDLACRIALAPLLAGENACNSDAFCYPLTNYRVTLNPSRPLPLRNLFLFIPEEV